MIKGTLFTAWSAALALSLALTVGGATAAPPTTGLVLNEIMAGPASDWDQSGTFSSRDDEWIELRNAGDLHLDLTGYYLTDADTIPRYAFSGTMAADERRVVFGSDAHAWERDNGYPAFGLSLSNSGDSVLLWHTDGSDTTLVDSYRYGRHVAAADRTIGRMNDREDWALFDGLNPYSGVSEPHGTGCNPSPGSANICASTPARNVSWGAIKAAYR